MALTGKTESNETWRKIIALDPYLEPYAPVLKRRAERLAGMERRLTAEEMTIAEFASGHEYFGMHFRDGGWVFREWAPNAEAIYLVGDMNGWQEQAPYAMDKDNRTGVWEIHLPAERLSHGDLYRLRIHWQGASGDRIPAYARRVVQDPHTNIFNTQVWHPEHPYQWRHPEFKVQVTAPLVYEAHIGMAQEEERIGTYTEFKDNVLPHVVKAGYNVLQLMAIQEHPYYGSFGYQVSNFYAASSKFGTPDELKALVDAAHEAGLAVVMDIVHSHAVSNEVEGLSRFDGTPYQYFHAGSRGRHELWDSRLFDYGKIQVLHFLLSNCRFWLDEYNFDGFRFDGITSMLYLHHGQAKAFTTYDDYFDESVDEEALAYLALANKVIRQVRPDAITIAEDVSGMPGLALSLEEGGTGFDYRFAMGVPDNWIKVIKEYRDEDWPMGHIWYELTNRRAEEKTISYAESHDQALVGDQTVIFRLIGEGMYFHMHKDDPDMQVDRGIALHKMIRLITLATAGHGYLNFMGNEFGHPEWIDFPREGNNWSYKYARRQWHLMRDPNLKYRYLSNFDRDMIALAREAKLLETPWANLLFEHNEQKILAFERRGHLFVFNFHPSNSYTDYRIAAPAGKYRTVLDSDAGLYGGHNRLAPDQVHFTRKHPEEGWHNLQLYLPTRTAIVLKAE